MLICPKHAKITNVDQNFMIFLMSVVRKKFFVIFIFISVFSNKVDFFSKVLTFLDVFPSQDYFVA